MPYSPAERQRRSDLAKRLHREGKLGGRLPAQRSVEVRRQRAARASQFAQELVIAHAAEIEEALVDALKRGSRAQKIKASEALLKLALAGERLDVTAERTDNEHMDRQAALDLLARKLTSTTATGALVRGHIEGHALDIE